MTDDQTPIPSASADRGVESPTASRQPDNPAARPVSRWAIHRRLYDWVLSLADTKHATWTLFALSFAESSFFPIPPDVLLAPL